MAKKRQLTQEELAAQASAREAAEIQQAFEQGTNTLRDLISPSAIEIHSDYFRLGNKYGRTIYIYGYPRSIYTGWLSPIINIDEVIDVSMYIYPVESAVVMKNLRTKVTQLEATMSLNAEKGKIRDPELEAAITDAEELRDQLQLGAEKFFRFGFYVTIWADSLDEMKFIQQKIETIFGQQMVFSKVANSQQEQGMNSTMPQCADQLQIRRNMNTGAISTSFPFTSADLTQDKGILYGINMHNNGLVIFDRFSLENANMVVFAKSGAGKSFTVKLEALRSMMVGSEILIIDPENEYQKLCDAVGGSYVRLSLNSDVRINPFDLPKVVDSEDAGDALRANLVTLHGLFRYLSDIGINLDQDVCLNAKFSLPNKIFEYIKAETPMVASNLIERARIIQQYQIGLIVENASPEEVSQKINKLVNDKQLYDEMKKNCKIAAAELCWENEEKVLEKIYLR